MNLKKFESNPARKQRKVRSRMETLLGEKALDKINQSWVLIVGAGVGGTYVAHDLARKGYNLKICDGDKVELANLGTQKYVKKDLGKNKAVATAKHSVEKTSLHTKTVGIPYMFSQAVNKGIDLFADVVVCFTDSFLSRFEVAEYFYEVRPVVFAGLGESGTWGWSFVQKPYKACLRCFFPDVDPNLNGSCSGLSIDSVKLTSSLVTYAVDSLILNHKFRKRKWNYREIDLSGYSASYDRIKKIERRKDCELCSQCGG